MTGVGGGNLAKYRKHLSLCIFYVFWEGASVGATSFMIVGISCVAQERSGHQPLLFCENVL